MKPRISIIGGGLAGIEAAYQIAKRDIHVDLYEMRPETMTEAHTTGFMGEMVCSNSLGSNEISSASGILKEELRRLDSFLISQAEQFRVPAGSSLSVDRLRLAEHLSHQISAFPGITVHRKEIQEIPVQQNPVLICTGPLTSPGLAASISRLTIRKNLFFFDATSPLIRAESIRWDAMFSASRYNKGSPDFFNIPLQEDQYHAFVDALVQAESVEIKEFEQAIYFDACLPIEEIARRGHQSLAFGPLKPVGLIDPRTGKMPFAVVQLRPDDVHQHFFQLIGFQTRLKYGEQRRIFRMLPGLEEAEFERFGRMHRNTYINAPLILNPFYQMKTRPGIFFCGQISGVEGYVESVASGLTASLNAVKIVKSLPLEPPPETTAVGALAHYISHSAWKDFKPSKFSFGLIPDQGLSGPNKKEKKQAKAERALRDLDQWIKRQNI